MASAVYNIFKKELMNGNFNLQEGSDVIKVMLIRPTASYTPDVDADLDYADISANEVANGNGYTTGGATLTTKAVSQDNTDDEGMFDADDVTWGSSTIDAEAAVLYDVTNSNKLICYIDFGGTKSSSSGDFKIEWNAEGILNLT